MKHVHAELIKQWADDTSKTVQFWNGNAWDRVDGQSPLWNPIMQYRIKPDPRATRDTAIAQAVLVACLHSRFTIPGEDGIDLAAIIATVKE